MCCCTPHSHSCPHPYSNSYSCSYPYVVDHVDTDLGRYTICSTYDEGAVEGGFQYAGHYVPLASGHAFVFDARWPHSMCGDVVKSKGSVRWSTAAYLPATFVKNHHEGGHCY